MPLAINESDATGAAHQAASAIDFADLGGGHVGNGTPILSWEASGHDNQRWSPNLEVNSLVGC